ncbi:MAG: penicillin acylase family protein [Actinomycetota bacterium]
MSDQIRAMAVPSLFPVEGRLEVPGLEAAATVERDRWGTPRITAASLDDLWFVQGMVTAGERLFQLELFLRAATGRLSEVFGEQTYDDDVFTRTIGLNRAGVRHAEDTWTDLDHEMHASFRAGVRAWIDTMAAKPVEYQLLDLEPDLPDDAAPYAAAFALLAWNLSNNWEAELLRAELDDRLGRPVTDTLLPVAPASGGVGSNNWVIAGRHTASGGPLLANDPHLLATQPGIWLELVLRAPGYEARGVAAPFTPGIFLGTTPHHAWGATNVTGDVADLYEEQLDDDGTAARTAEGWLPLMIHEEAITVRGEPEPRIQTVRESRHGPILTHGVAGMLHTRYRPLDRTYALRWAGHDATLRPSLALEVAQAPDFEAFRTAMLQVECAGQNFVYADVEGHIGYQCTGRHPIRAAGDGTRPVPGWDDEHEWVGWIEPEDLPWELDPQRGWIATANNDIQPAGYPHLITKDFHEPTRRDRILALLGARDRHDVASMLAIQLDTVSLAVPPLLAQLCALEPHTDAQRDALDLLRPWDADLRASSHPAALFQAWISAIMRRLFAERMGLEVFAAYQGFRETFLCRVLPNMLADQVDPDALRAALDDAIAEVTGRAWGEMHTLVLAHPLARIPGLEEVFTAATIPWGGDSQTVAQGGFDPLLGYRAGVIPSVRAIYDLADLERSASVLPTGTSGNPASPHWNDQAALYEAGDTKPAGFTTATVSTLTIVPV